MGKHYGGLFQDWEVAVAESLVNRFQRGWTCLQREGIDDLLQECLLVWYYARETHDPKQGASAKTYMASIVRNRLWDLIRRRESGKRKTGYEAISLDESLDEDEDSPHLVDTALSASPDPSSAIHLRIDIQRILKSLPERQKRLCLLLGEGDLTVQEAAEQLNRSRSVVYEDLKRIRQAFEKQGITIFLKKVPDTF